jgi:probable HAF family extracellular repeat protein
MIDLGSLGGGYSNAFAVNAKGQVVGVSATAGDLEQHAFSWTQAGGMDDLGTLGGSYSMALDLNNNGQVVGEAFLATGERRAVLWNPKSVDTTPPVISVPADKTANATGPGGAVVTFTATATDENPANPEVTCAPPSGSVFAIGNTTVFCTATDAAGNTANAHFTVHVKGAMEQLAALHDAVIGVGPGSSLADKVGQAQAYLDQHNVADACGILSVFINQVTTQSGKSIPPVSATALIADATRIRAVLGC